MSSPVYYATACMMRTQHITFFKEREKARFNSRPAFCFFVGGNIVCSPSIIPPASNFESPDRDREEKEEEEREKKMSILPQLLSSLDRRGGKPRKDRGIIKKPEKNNLDENNLKCFSI